MGGKAGSAPYRDLSILSRLDFGAVSTRSNFQRAEKVAELLARAAPKGLLIVRDELAGWIASMNGFNSGARAFWIEAYGGRPYRVERKTDPDPIVVPHLAVAVYGGTQPDKLARLLREG